MSPPDMRRFNLKWAEDADGCRLWTGARTTHGYGNFYAGGKIWKAHRWVFLEQFGYLPAVVMHRCDKPSCVNWEGCLAPGTHWDNMRDMAAKGRAAHMVGVANGRAKLTESDVVRIHALVATGASGRKIAEQFGVSHSLIKKIARGETWPHLFPGNRKESAA